MAFFESYLRQSDYMTFEPDLKRYRSTTSKFGLKPGQFVSGTKVSQIKGMVNYQNRLRGFASNAGILDYHEAASDYVEKRKAIEEAETPEEEERARRDMSP